MKHEIKQIITSQPEVLAAIQKVSELDLYVDKITRLATLIPYYTDSVLNGCIAYYANDPLKANAFLTILVVDPRCKGQGIGKLLLDFSITDLTRKGFHNYRLEVSKLNQAAITLYKNAGFLPEQELEGSFLMNLTLNGN